MVSRADLEPGDVLAKAAELVLLLLRDGLALRRAPGGNGASGGGGEVEGGGAPGGVLLEGAEGAGGAPVGEAAELAAVLG